MVQGNSDIVIRLRADVAQAQAELASVTRVVRKMAAPTKEAYNEVAKATQIAENATDRLNRAIGRVPFSGYAMSIMFFGMAMQRMFTSIAKNGIKTFQDVMHSTEGSVTEFDKLNSSTAYLGFVIGQALEPVISFIIPIVDAVAEWAAENPKLTATIVTLGIVLGTLFAVGGAGKLALDGFVGLKGVLATTKVGTGLAGLTLTTPWIVALAAAAAAAALLTKAFNETPEAGENIKKSFGTLDEPLKDLKETVGSIWTAVTGLELNWESVAWTGAWAAAILVEVFRNVITVIDGILEAIDSLIIALAAAANAALAMWYAITGDQDASQRARLIAEWQLGQATEGLLNALDKTFSVNTRAAELLFMGPKGYMEENTLPASQGMSIYFGEVKIEPRPGEGLDDVMNRMVKEMGIYQ